MSDREPSDRTAAPSEAGADDDHHRRLQRARRARVAKAIAILAIVVLLIIFVLRNSGQVPVDFVFFTRQARLIWVLLVTAVVGGIVGYLLGRPGKGVRLHDDADTND